MKNLIQILSLALLYLPFNSHAEWREVGAVKDVSLYLDPSKIASPDSISKRVVLLLSYNSKQQVDKGSPYFSVLSQLETDCQKMTYKIVTNVYYSAQMGRGNIVDTSNIPPQEQEIRSPVKDSVLGDVIAYVCSKNMH